MKKIATHEAKTHLSRYLKQVSEGESFIISRGRTPVAKLVPISDSYSEQQDGVGGSSEAPLQVSEAALTHYPDRLSRAKEDQERAYERAMKRYFKKSAQPLKSKSAKYPKRESLYER